MFIFNISKNKLIGIISTIGAFIILLFFLLNGAFSQSIPPEADRFAIGDTEQQRRTFIESYGIELSPASPTIEKMQIPEEFDESFKDYEMMQNEMGLSLYTYRGKTLTKYTYEVTNHQESFVTPIYVNLFMYQQQVAAADIIAPNLKNGFIKSLESFE